MHVCIYAYIGTHMNAHADPFNSLHWTMCMYETCVCTPGVHVLGFLAAGVLRREEALLAKQSLRGWPLASAMDP